ncbi:MAG: ATP-binding protein [Candidatus Curtissbacteria bacterium]|nr:ATP-binding protein [Candidatus Curtissbacteria bacterium]
MELTFGLVIVTVLGTLAGIAGYFLMRREFKRELEINRRKQEELAQKAYEMTVLKEIGDRIGYSLDAAKIVEIISRSLEQLLSYSTVSSMIYDSEEDKIRFKCNVIETVSQQFINDVKVKMLAAFSEMQQVPVVDLDVDESISGTIVDESGKYPLSSFFNLPITISGRVVGLINVASRNSGLYEGDDTEVLYRIAMQASQAVTKLQEVLENEKSRLSQAVESLSDGLVMVNSKYQLILSNRRISHLLQIVENPKLFDIVNALSGSFDIRTKMEEAYAKEGSLPAQEVAIRDKVFQVFCSRVVDNKGGKPMAIVVLFHDITDAKKLERLRQDFMAMMVHELRAPLTSIKSSVAMINSGDVETNKYLKTIGSTSETMLELVGDLLDVAKLEAGKFDVICNAADLSEVVVERVDSFRPIVQEKRLQINVNIEPDLPKGWFDKVRIKQVLNNLLSNAIKYTDVGEITVSVKQQQVGGVPIDILVSVADTGIGIEEDQIEKLFSRFGQLESGRGNAGLKSSGLGLYITRKIVEASDGKIWVESRGEGSGSTFNFTVPLAQGSHKDVSDTHETIGNFTTEKVAQA